MNAQPAIPVLRKRLWRYFAEYIRLRDSPGGVGRCISCNTPQLYPNKHGRWQAGHYIQRSKDDLSLYFSEQNVNGQCRRCNYRREGNKAQYRIGLINKYGIATVSYLESQPVYVPWTKKEFMESIKHYKNRLKLIKSEREL